MGNGRDMYMLSSIWDLPRWVFEELCLGAVNSEIMHTEPLWSVGFHCVRRRPRERSSGLRETVTYKRITERSV